MALEVMVTLCMLLAVLAIPESLSYCSAWQPGDNGYMGSGPIQDGAAAGGNAAPCAIDVAGELVPAGTYIVTVSAPQLALFKLFSSDGQCLNPDESSLQNGGLTLRMSKNFSWTAPATVTSEGIAFSALCNSGAGEAMYTASPVQLCLPEGCEATNTTLIENSTFLVDEEASTTAGAETNKDGSAVGQVATVSGIQLTDGMTMDFMPAPAGIELTIRFDSASWVGIGISSGSSVSMHAGGQGADIAVCSNGVSARHWVTAKSMSEANGEEIQEATCAQENGQTVLTFSRSLSAGREERAATPGRLQQVIWAHGNDGEKGLSYHGSRAGGLFIDFATGEIKEIKRAGNAPLYLHAVLMILGWGFFLPSGAVLAKCLKRAPSAPVGVWFAYHLKLQLLGSALQFLGLGAAIWFAEEYSSHMNTSHSIMGTIICLLAGLQVVGGACRPEKKHGEKQKSADRWVFEVLHKGLGWTAVVLGMLNIVLGLVLIYDRNYDDTVKGVASTLTAVCILPILAYSVLSAIQPDNFMLRFLLVYSRSKVNLRVVAPARSSEDNDAGTTTAVDDVAAQAQPGE